VCLSATVTGSKWTVARHGVLTLISNTVLTKEVMVGKGVEGDALGLL
jgi:succinylglutamate desuccinylase